jgi:hypothetical protein
VATIEEVMTMRFTSDKVYVASRMNVVLFTVGAMSCYSQWSVMPEVMGEAQWMMYWTPLAASV